MRPDPGGLEENGSRIVRVGCDSLEPVLRDLIPGHVQRFPKLMEKGDPYKFDRWEEDRSEVLCLYYKFKSRDRMEWNHKRVPVPEIRAAMRVLMIDGRWDRAAFDRDCPIASSAGPCGYAIIGRVFESLGVATHDVNGRCFRLVALERVRQLLEGSEGITPHS